MQTQHTLDKNIIWEPLYQRSINAYPWEIELINSPSVRRLKFLYHFGTAALSSPIVHSRYEHSLGVWALTTMFLPDDLELRIAAILHDIGHLPFSHAAEKSLNVNHHNITKELILTGNIASILNKHGFDPLKIINVLDSNTALTNKNDLLALDHLDSFFRDTFHSGSYSINPANVVSHLEIINNCVSTDYKHAMYLIKLITADHQMMLKPLFLAMDELLSMAIMIYCTENKLETINIQSMVDYEILYLLQNSQSNVIKRILHYLLWSPNEIKISDIEDENTIKISPRKGYKKQPLVNGIPLFKVEKNAEDKYKEIDEMIKPYYIIL